MIARPVMTAPDYDPLTFTEFVVEWEDGRQVWTEDLLAAGRAVRYRHRFLARRFIPFSITAWHTPKQGQAVVVWELEWTAEDMTLTPADFECLRKQRVPLRLMDQMFKHPEIEAGRFAQEMEDGENFDRINRMDGINSEEVVA